MKVCEVFPICYGTYFFFLLAGPECIPCEFPLFDKSVFIRCDQSQGIRLDLIGGFNVCGKGKAKDTRGECKPAYRFSNSLEYVDVQPREIEEPKKPRNLRKYLQSINRFN